MTLHTGNHTVINALHPPADLAYYQQVLVPRFVEAATAFKGDFPKQKIFHFICPELRVSSHCFFYDNLFMQSLRYSLEYDPRPETPGDLAAKALTAILGEYFPDGSGQNASDLAARFVQVDS